MMLQYDRGWSEKVCEESVDVSFQLQTDDKGKVVLAGEEEETRESQVNSRG